MPAQEGREAEARAMLEAAGYSYRLAQSVLRYDVNGDTGVDIQEGEEEKRKEFVQVVDRALPEDMLEHLEASVYAS